MAERSQPPKKAKKAASKHKNVVPKQQLAQQVFKAKMETITNLEIQEWQQHLSDAVNLISSTLSKCLINIHSNISLTQ